MKSLIGTRLRNRNINSILYIDRYVKITKGIIALLRSASDEPTVEGLESLREDYSGPAKGKPTKKMNFYPEIIPHKVDKRKNVTAYSVHIFESRW